MDNVLFYLSFSLSLRLLSRGASRPVLETGQDLLYRYGFTPRKGPASNKNNHIAGEQSDVESFRAIQFTYIYMYSIYIYIYMYIPCDFKRNASNLKSLVRSLVCSLVEDESTPTVTLQSFMKTCGKIFVSKVW